MAMVLATPTLTGPPRVSTRGPPMGTPPPLPTTPLAATATASMALATPTPTGPPRVFTRGKLSPATPLPSPTIPLEATATTSTAPATLMSTGPPRVSTRGRPLAPATRQLSVLTAMATTARIPSTTSRLPATMVMWMRGATATTLLSTTDSTFKRFRAMQNEHENVLVTLCYAYCSTAPSSKPNHNY